MKNHFKLTFVILLATASVAFAQFENGLNKNEFSVSISGTVGQSSYHPQYGVMVDKAYFANLDSAYTPRVYVSNANASSPSLNYTHWFTKPTSRWTHGVTAGVGFGGFYEVNNSYKKAVRYNLDTLAGQNTNSFAVVDSVDVSNYGVSNEGSSMTLHLGWKLNFALSKHWQLRTGLALGTQLNFKPTTYYSYYQSSSTETTFFSNNGVQQTTNQIFNYKQEIKKVDAIDMGKIRGSYVVIPLEAHYLFHLNQLKSKPVFGVYTAFISGLSVISYQSVQTTSFNWNAHLGLSYYF